MIVWSYYLISFSMFLWLTLIPTVSCLSHPPKSWQQRLQSTVGCRPITAFNTSVALTTSCMPVCDWLQPNDGLPQVVTAVTGCVQAFHWLPNKLPLKTRWQTGCDWWKPLQPIRASDREMMTVAEARDWLMLLPGEMQCDGVWGLVVASFALFLFSLLFILLFCLLLLAEVLLFLLTINVLLILVVFVDL